jgi:hypothetical protein
MFYIVPLIVAILVGTLVSRQLKVLMLWDLRAVFLLPLALFADLMPLWIGTYWPDSIWTTDRHLLMGLQATSRGLFLLFALINLYFSLWLVDWPGVRQALRNLRIRPIRRVLGGPAEPGVRRLHRWRQMRILRRPNRIPLGRHLLAYGKILFRQAWQAVLSAFRELPAALLRLGKHLVLRLMTASLVHPRRILAPDQDAPPLSRHANRLRLIGLTLAVIGFTGQLLVLLNNQGYWPLSESYLAHLSDPLLIQGIRNGALRMSRLIDDQSQWAWLGQVLPWPSFDSSAPAKVVYISPTDLVLATSLFLTTLSLFPSRKDL